MTALVLATIALWLGGAFLGEFHCKPFPCCNYQQLLLICSWSGTEPPCPGQSVWGQLDYTTDKPGRLHLVFVGMCQSCLVKNKILDQIASHPSHSHTHTHARTHTHTHTHTVQWHHCAGNGANFLYLLFLICGTVQ